MPHLLDDPVGASAEDADGLEVVGLDPERLLADRDRRSGVEVARDRRGRGPRKGRKEKNNYEEKARNEK